MSEITITRHDSPSGGEYQAVVAGSDAVGRLTYQRMLDGQGGSALSADHTLVPPEIGGRGVAARLVEALVDGARLGGEKVIPRCSYVDAAFRRHPEWADLL